MTTKVTNHRFSRENFKRDWASFRLFVTSTGRDIVDQEFFTKYRVGELKFKCTTWSRVGGLAARIEAEAALPVLAAHFSCDPKNIELRFSRTAGCSCGCSPGFVGRILDAKKYTDEKLQPLNQANIWMDVALTPEQENSIREFARNALSTLRLGMVSLIRRSASAPVVPSLDLTPSVTADATAI